MLQELDLYRMSFRVHDYNLIAPMFDCRQRSKKNWWNNSPAAIFLDKLKYNYNLLYRSTLYIFLLQFNKSLTINCRTHSNKKK